MASQPPPWGAPALLDGARYWPAAQVARWVHACVERLTAAGIRPGDRVGLLAPNCAAAVIALLALLQRGAVAAPLSTRDPQALTADKLRRSDAQHLLFTSSQDAAATWPCTPYALDDLVGQPPLADATGTFAGIAPAPAPAPNPAHFSHLLPLPASAAIIIFTSGSSGVPKAVLHHHASLSANAVGANANLPLRAGDRWLLSLPLYHVGGLGILWRCAQVGATVVLPGAGSADLSARLAEQRITHLSLVPTQLLRLLAEPQTDWAAALQALILGGAPIPASLTAAAAARGLPLFTSYGLTEMGSQVTATAPGDPPAAWHTAGRLLIHRELVLAPDGEILVRGATLAAGLCTPGGGLTPLPAADGWYHTGDRGAWDADGRLLVLGRRDAMFISGGENIYPEPIEAALLSLDGVQQALVVPVADPVFGQRPVAFVDRIPPLTLADAHAHLATRFPRFMLPIALHPWPASHTAMKPDRAAFTRLAAELAAP